MASPSPEVPADPVAALDGSDAIRPPLRVTEHRGVTRAVSGIAGAVEHRLVRRHHLDREPAPVRILLEMVRSAEAGELMRRMLGTMLQELVDAEATAFIGAGRTSGRRQHAFLPQVVRRPARNSTHVVPVTRSRRSTPGPRPCVARQQRRTAAMTATQS